MTPSAVRRRRGEQGQAMAETALFSVLVVVLAFGVLSLIPVHRARTAATSAAYACAQFLSQSPNRSRAEYNAYRAARSVLDSSWSALLNTQYTIDIVPPGGSGSPGGCAVYYRVQLPFDVGLLQPGWGKVFFISRSENWKARW